MYIPTINIQIECNVKKSQLMGGKLVGYLQSMALEQYLNLGPPDNSTSPVP